MNVIRISIPATADRNGNPVPSTYTGYRAGINFANGEGYSKVPLNDGQLAFFAKKGYTIEGEIETEGATSKRTGGRKGGTGKGDPDA